jgi:predicted regulator of Ras-like GTPase activity (Roadblock/LC7/MglB family)
MAKVEALKNQLETLKSAIPDLKGVLLASNEGLPIAHSFNNGTDPNRVAALAAAVSTLGRKITDNLASGALGEITVQAAEGALYVYSAGPKAILAVVTAQGANTGLIHLEARQTAKDIAELF